MLKKTSFYYSVLRDLKKPSKSRKAIARFAKRVQKASKEA